MRALTSIAIAIALVATGGCEHRPRPPKVEPPPVAANDEAAAAADAAPEPTATPDAAPAAAPIDAGAAGPTAPAGDDAAAAAAAAALRATNPDQFDTCTAAAQHALAVMAAETPEANRAEMLKQQPTLMTAMREQCIKASWPAALLKCIADAKDMNGLTGCQSLVPKGTPP